MTTVNFKQIPGFSRYFVTPDGQLFTTVKDDSGSITLKQLSDSVRYSGYMANRLIDDEGITHYIQRGRLVLLAYKADEYFDGAECDHINREKTDNNVDNVRWVTHSDNCKNRTVTKRHKPLAIYLIYDDGGVCLYTRRKYTNLPTPTLSRLLRGAHSSKYKCRACYENELHA